MVFSPESPSFWRMMAMISVTLSQPSQAHESHVHISPPKTYELDDSPAACPPYPELCEFGENLLAKIG